MIDTLTGSAIYLRPEKRWFEFPILMDEQAESSPDRAPTAPESIPVSVRCAFEDEQHATAFAHLIATWVRELSRDIDLSRLDGITVAGDYNQALLDLDRGYETSHELKPSDEYAVGVAMTPSVIRDGNLKSHMVFNAGIVAPLDNVDDPLFPQALHVVVHECAHVEVMAKFDRAFPNVLLRKSYDNIHDGIRWQIILACWDEYAATWISATYGENPTEAYEATFIEMLGRARNEANERIKSYRVHRDIGQVMEEVYGIYGNLMKFAAYHLGNMAGRGLSIEDLPKTKAQLEGHWFAAHFEALGALCRALADSYGDWKDTVPFEAIGDLVDEIVEEGGVLVTRSAKAGLYIDIPFSPETMPA